MYCIRKCPWARARGGATRCAPAVAAGVRHGVCGTGCASARAPAPREHSPRERRAPRATARRRRARRRQPHRLVTRAQHARCRRGHAPLCCWRDRQGTSLLRAGARVPLCANMCARVTTCTALTCAPRHSRPNTYARAHRGHLRSHHGAVPGRARARGRHAQPRACDAHARPGWRGGVGHRAQQALRGAHGPAAQGAGGEEEEPARRQVAHAPRAPRLGDAARWNGGDNDRRRRQRPTGRRRRRDPTSRLSTSRSHM